VSFASFDASEITVASSSRISSSLLLSNFTPYCNLMVTAM